MSQLSGGRAEVGRRPPAGVQGLNADSWEPPLPDILISWLLSNLTRGMSTLRGPGGGFLRLLSGAELQYSRDSGRMLLTLLLSYILWGR